MSTTTFDPAAAATIIDILRYRAAHQPDQLAYTFLENGEVEARHLTYGELERAVRAVAGELQRIAEPGSRAILAYPQSLEVLVSFLACLSSGIIAIPAPLPQLGRAQRTVERLVAIAADAQAKLLLTTAESLAIFDSPGSLESLATMQSLATDRFELSSPDDYRHFDPQADSLAYLQYTSGSTARPRGVMVGHRHVIANSASIAVASGYGADCRLVSWVPYFHDYGLVEGYLQPLFSGFPAWVFSPLAFIERPTRWFRAIQRHRATHSLAPTFAFALALGKVSAAEIEQFDLSNWRVAGNGAEPIHVETARRFVKAFAPAGFRADAFWPEYGLAETTLVVSEKRRGQVSMVLTLSPEALEKHRVVEVSSLDLSAARQVISCGAPLDCARVEIVDPHTLRRCAPDCVGEVWVAGPTVTFGYWNRPDETAAIFQARLADTGEGPFLRTGDLGFLRDGELYITGRLKDLIIVHGVNHYPQDIEETVERSHRLVRPGCSAAFAVDVAGEERLVVMAESKATPEETADIEAAIREQVVVNHGLSLYRLMLVEPGGLPKTSSGKKQRSAAREEYYKRFSYDGSSTAEVQPTLPVPRVSTPIAAASPLVGEAAAAAPMPAKQIELWLRTWLATRAGISIEEIGAKQSFAFLGLVSIDTIELVADLKAWLGVPISPTVIYDCGTPTALARMLAGEETLPGVGWQHSAGADRVAVAGSPSKAIPPDLTHEAIHALPETPTTEFSDAADEPIAIVGLACRFPGADTPEEFWQNLSQGVVSIQEVPSDRWSISEYYDPRPRQPGKSVSKWGGFLRQVDRFDARFFGISPYEAERMDPQQRLMLELAWESLERAGYAGTEIAASSTGVFVGVSVNEYARHVTAQLGSLSGLTASGNYLAVVANRISHFLGVRGPSLAIDTACSSSLVAVHLAVQSLRQQECSTALVGGVQVLLAPDIFIDCSQAGMLAPDGLCKPFDDRANGFVRGEGGAMVVLKRLSDAQRDGDTIHAVIRGTAVNHDGHTNGLTAPSSTSQSLLIRRAYETAGVPPETIGYVEAHGTGTALGDPIEVEALTQAFSAVERSQFCALGSVKSNLGHLEPAAGAAGLLKVVLSLVHGELPPTLHLTSPNRYLLLESSPFYVVDRRRAWSAAPGPRRAGVSSFGFGGTNAHVVLEQAPEIVIPDSASGSARDHLFVLSARSETALRTLIDTHLAQSIPDNALADLCFTLQVGRAHFAHRLAIVARSSEELQRKLAAAADRAGGLDAPADGIFTSSTSAGVLGRLAGEAASSAESAPGDGQASTRLMALRYVAGDDLDWSVLHVGQSRRHVPAPTYPFERQRYWLDRPQAAFGRDEASAPVSDKSAKAGHESPAPPASAHAIEKLLQESVAHALGFQADEIGLATNIQELGLNSILAAKAATEVSRRCGLELEAIDFFLQPTLGRLAAQLSAVPEWRSVFGGWATKPTDQTRAGDTSVFAAVAPPPVASPTMRNQEQVTAASAEADFHVRLPFQSQSRGFTASTAISRDIAVIGMACRFPGADSPEALWRNLMAGVDAVGPLPQSRRSDAGVETSTDDNLPFAWRHGGFLDDVAGFDAQLFAISPHEARRMDPQQRLFLECAWQTLERAGYAPKAIGERRVGVFAGVSTSDYARIWDRQGSGNDAHFGSGTALAMVANRASYVLNLVGPSVSIDTACSGSLVALALACQSLRAGACRMALAGGVSLILAPELSDALAQGGMLSPSGRCHTFDDHADGYVRGEGVGVVLLKPLAEALADGDQVLAVIKGLAVNHDGHNKPGLTAPSLAAQTELLSAAYEDAGVDPRSVTYVEAHGTGTALGDPIELAALRAVCGHDRAAGTCALGAAKSSLGHLESAAGIAGFIKTVLAISHAIIPPSLHFQTPNRRFEWAGAPFYVTDRPRDWTDEQRRAGVSSFGFGGANVHIVLEAVSSDVRTSCKRAQLPATTVSRSPLARIVAASSANLLVLSAETTTALRATTEGHLSYLNLPGGASLDDLCFTANTGRGAMRHRLAIVARYRDQLADRLRHLRDWEDRGKLQGSLVFASEEAGSFTTTTEATSHSDQVLELWRAQCAQLTSDVIEALGSCVGGSLWQDHLLPISRRFYGSANVRSSSSTVTFREEEAIALWSALGQLFVWGVNVDWAQVYAASNCRRVLLPTYPFERKRYWLSALATTHDARVSQSSSTPMPIALRSEIRDHLDSTPSRASVDAAPPINMEARIELRLVEMLASALDAEPSTIDPRRPVVELGVDSILAVDMARRLSQQLRRAISPTVLYETGSLSALAARLLAEDVVAATRLVSVEQSSAHSDSHSELRPIARSLEEASSLASGPIVSSVAQPVPVRRRAIGDPNAAEPIAIIGVGVRVPGASSLTELWSLVRAGRDVVTPVSPERWSLFAARDYEERETAIAGNHFAALFSDLEWFDPQFFRLSPREAEELDPQQRLLLETAWETLESAGYAGGSLTGTSTGVFVGGMASEYLTRLLAMPKQLGAYAATGNSLSILANRLSYSFNLNGPCLALDTACSSSLVAVHLAIESLRRGECEMALVAGTQVGLAPSHFQLMRKFGGLSPRGRCRPFAQGADGYALGEGVGVVLIKPLARAFADRDHVLAVIRASAVNHGGQAAGLTVPNPAAQAKVIRAALDEARLSADEITLLESHGTGTALGDPIELQGLLKAFRVDTSRSQFCAIGSVKANIGHLEPAAGMLGLIKLMAALRAHELPPTLHIDEPNRSISFADSPFYVSDRARPWISPAGIPRRAGLSSFGYGGTNAHVIVEETATSSPALNEQRAADATPHVFVLSARSRSALKTLASRFADQFVSSKHPWLDICWTAATGRPHWPQRLAFVARDPSAAAHQLRSFVEDDEATANGPLSRANPVRFAGYISATNAIEQKLHQQRLRELLTSMTSEARSAFDQLCLNAGRSNPRDLRAGDATTTLVASTALRDTKAYQMLCEAFAATYALGGEVDWHNLLIGRSPRRVPLPTYPFERQRLWRDSQLADTDAAENTKLGAPRIPAIQEDEPDSVLNPWLHEVQWRDAPRGEVRTLTQGIWIVFDDEAALGSDLIARLKSTGARVVRVLPRENSTQHEIEWHTPSEGRIAISPDVCESYAKELDSVVCIPSRQIAGIVHLWSQHRSIQDLPQTLTLSSAELCSSAAWRLRVISGLRLLQALSIASARPAAGVWFVTSGAHAIGPHESVIPAASAIWGAIRAAKRERSDLPLRLRDLSLEPSTDEVQSLIDDLREVAPAFQCGFRDGQRFTPGLAPLITLASDALQSSWPIANDGVYLISGGLGAIGLAVAESLVDQGARRLVLMSRRGLPNVRADDNAATIVKRLRESGAIIWTPCVDVRERPQIEQLVQQVRGQLGSVRGVVHAAGVLADRLLPNVEPADFERVLAPKLIGAENLLGATANRSLDFFVVISSLAAHLGNAGQVTYAAASSYLDSWVIAARRQLAIAKLSVVDLGPWDEAGMALQAAMGSRGQHEARSESSPSRGHVGQLHVQMRQFWRERGMEPVPPRIGCQAIAMAARHGVQQLIVAKETASRSLTGQHAAAHFRPLSEVAQWSPGPLHAPTDDVNSSSSIGSRDAAALRRRLRSLVAHVTAEALRLPADQVDHDKEFREHGLDSLMADEVVRRLRLALQLPELRVGELFARPTVARLADWLGEKFADQITTNLREAESDSPPPTIAAPPIGSPPIGANASPSHTRITSLNRSCRDVAVIGYACRFPGAIDAMAFGQMLREQRSAVRPMPPDRWQAACQFDPHYSATFGHEPPVGAFLTDIDRFDPEFFRIAPTEAAQIDPRQRVFLEVANHAAEHAGYGGSALRGANCGVFVGTGCEDYYAGMAGELYGEHAAPGGTAAALPGRLAYFLDLHGPALAIDTACSSSLVALHHALESVRRGECEYAFVGGVHLHVRLCVYLGLQRMGATSPRGICRPFDRRADGIVPGEGVAVLLIRPLDAALAAGDTIYGVIRGSAVNNDGRSNGLLAPNPLAQAQLLQSAWNDAEVDPASISYLEAHGTGTLLGDPVEWGAIDEVLRSVTSRRQFVNIGGVKANIGHADAAAGLAGVIKVLLNFEHRELLPTRGLLEPNPRFELESSPLVVVDRNRPWRPVSHDGQPLPCRAGVSSFGFAGTNAHVVLEEPPAADELADDNVTHVLALSALDEAHLRRMAADYAAHLKENSNSRWIDVCHTANTGRAQLRERLVVSANNCREGFKALQAIAAGGDHATSVVHLRDEATRAGLRRTLEFRVAEMSAADLQRLRAASSGQLAAEVFDRANTDQRAFASAANRDPVGADNPDGNSTISVLQAAAELYVLGATIDWAQVEDYGSARRIALPLYPYRDERYWLALPQSESFAANRQLDPRSSNSEQSEATSGGLLAVPAWKPCSVGNDSRQAVQGRWLIVGELSKFATDLAQQLREAGCEAELVPPSIATAISDVEMRSTSIEGVAERYRRAVLNKLNESDRWTDIVYCALPGLASSNEQRHNAICEVDTPSRDLVGLLELIQASQNSKAQTATNLWVVTSGAQAVAGGHDCVHPENATLWGLARVIPRECPQLRVRTVDVDVQEVHFQPGEVARSLVGEFARRTTPIEIAYRKSTRFVLTRQPLADSPDSAVASIRQRGVYMITGGLGGIGLVLARWLAQRYQARMVLLSRTALPPSDRWGATIADHHTPAHLRSKLAELVAIQAAGGEVIVIAGDVAEPATLHCAEQIARKRFGEISGVFHAAGTIRKCLIRDTTAAGLPDVLRPKVAGAEALIAWARREPFDFVLFFSSVAGLDGNVFQGEYSAANRALDALAAAAQAEGLPIQSVAWDLWHGIGMGRGMAEVAAESGRTALDSADALAALERALAWGYPEISIRASAAEFCQPPRVSESTPSAAAPSFETRTSKLARGRLVNPAPEFGNGRDSDDLRIPVRRALREAVATTLGLSIERVGVEQSLPELGLDSLLAVKFMRGLSQATGKSLSATLPFDFASIALLADHLTATLPAESLEAWLKLGLAESPSPATSQSDKLHGGDVLQLHSGRRVKILSRRGPAWPG